MNALCQVIYALVQARKKTHHATLPVSIMMEAINVNVQMDITYSKEIRVQVSYLKKCSLNALGHLRNFFRIKDKRSRPIWFFKMLVRKILQNSQAEHQSNGAQFLIKFLDKACNFARNRTPSEQCFCGLFEIFQNYSKDLPTDLVYVVLTVFKANNKVMRTPSLMQKPVN